MGRMLSIDTPLITPRLLLRPFRSDDVPALHELRTRPDVLRYLYWPPPTPERTEEIVRRRLTMTTLARQGDALVLAAELRDTGRMIGEADLTWTSAEHRHGEIGVILHPDAQRLGYATEAATALLDLAFDRLGLHRVTAATNARNEASARVLRRLGMRQEGHLRQCVSFAGEWHDELLFAVLADEWAAGGRPWIRPYAEADWATIARIHDAARLDELRGSAGPDAFLPLEQTAEGEGLFDGLLWVAETRGTVTGFVALDGGEVTWLYVDPAHYRRGIGRALLRHAVTHAGDRAQVTVLDGNPNALALYRSEGFVVLETRTGPLAGNERFTATGHLMERRTVTLPDDGTDRTG